MLWCDFTKYDYSSKFIIVKGIIIFKHDSDRIVNTMLYQQLTRQGTMLQVASLVGKLASWLAAKRNVHTRQIRDSTHVIAKKLLTYMHVSLTTHLGF